MIVHPDRERGRLATIGGRLLEETFGLIGKRINDPHNAERVWVIDSVYQPIRGRAIGGIRAHAKDDKDFVAFVNQRDLEVLLGLGEPGRYCRWLGRDYPDPRDARDWIGFFMDEEDLEDDLFAREQELRVVQEQVRGTMLLPPGIELTRRLHLSDGVDCEELLLSRGDQYSVPDMRVETVGDRWIRVERTILRWREL